MDSVIGPLSAGRSEVPWAGEAGGPCSPRYLYTHARVRMSLTKILESGFDEAAGAVRRRHEHATRIEPCVCAACAQPMKPYLKPSNASKWGEAILLTEPADAADKRLAFETEEALKFRLSGVDPPRAAHACRQVLNLMGRGFEARTPTQTHVAPPLCCAIHTTHLNPKP